MAEDTTVYDFTVKQHDRGEFIELLVEEWDKDANAGAGGFVPYAGLADADEIMFLMKVDNTLVFGDATSPAPGVVRYTFVGDDLAIAGIYNGEVQVTRDAGAVIKTFPRGGTHPTTGEELPLYFTIEVTPDLGPGA